jgi:Xaa-Pro aminopeptidase
VELTDSLYADRVRRARSEMDQHGIDALLLSVGADLPYLVGYQAMALERLTMLVLTADIAQLVIPAFEAARVTKRGDTFDVSPWEETEDPIAMVSSLLGSRTEVCMGDSTMARFVVDLIAARPDLHLRRSTEVMKPMRALKDAAEVEALRAAAHAADRVAADLQGGRIPLIGRPEADVSADLSRRLIEEGHDKVNFAIVASGPNAASPHHAPGERIIQAGEVVLCDFGGTMDGYCSDITRCVHTGPVPTEFQRLYDVLFEAQAAGVAASGSGGQCQDVDRASRSVIDAAGYGEYFIHRTGHGIGMEAHEDPYMIEGNDEALLSGHAFSVEPGIYVPGQWGARLEDIVVATDAGADSLNRAEHTLVVVEA